MREPPQDGELTIEQLQRVSDISRLHDTPRQCDAKVNQGFSRASSRDAEEVRSVFALASAGFGKVR